MYTARRQVLAILGGGVILAAGSAGAFLATRTPKRALAPWGQAGIGYTDPRLKALSYAILAPNPHNRQPWVVRLDDGEGFTLFAQTDRKLPHTDPMDRQITIGLGCFLELARQAAAEDGYSLSVTPFPDGEPNPILDGRPVARAILRPGQASPDPLFAQVLARRSCKEPFDMTRQPDESQLQALAATATSGVGVAGTVATDQVAALKDIGWRAHVVESETPHTYLESVNLMRFGKSEIEAAPDGIDLGGPFLETLHLAGALNREQLRDIDSAAYRQGMDMYQEMFINTPAFVWMSTTDNTRYDQLAAGASWVRLNLAATGMGLALHPVSQSLQEYAEMAPLFDEVHGLLGASPTGRIQMLGRLGYGPDIAPSPRWPLKTRLVSS